MGRRARGTSKSPCSESAAWKASSACRESLGTGAALLALPQASHAAANRWITSLRVRAEQQLLPAAAVGPQLRAGGGTALQTS